MTTKTDEQERGDVEDGTDSPPATRHTRRPPTMRQTRRASQGFTLTELLTTVAIVAVLMALLLPVLQSVRRRAGEMTCASNLHQLHLGLEMYLQDHDEVFPVSYVEHPDGCGSSWREALGPYLRDRSVLTCPASEYRGAKLEELPVGLQATYALNAWLSVPDRTASGGPPAQPLSLACVQAPAGTVELCDAGYSNLPLALDLDHYLTLGMQEQPLPTERHQEAANYCFVDGHVKRMSEAATRSPEFLWDVAE